MTDYCEVNTIQIVSEVKERNRYYQALLEIQAIVNNDSDLQCDEKLSKVLNLCDKVLVNNTRK